MNEILSRLVESSPSLALLGIFGIIFLRAQSRKEEEGTRERTEAVRLFTEANRSMADSIAVLSNSVKSSNDVLHDFMESVIMAHQYQEIEHEQMVKLLEKMNGKG